MVARLNEMFRIIKKENKRACMKQCDTVFSKQYQELHDKLKANEYTNIHHFMKDIDTFAAEFAENGPKGEEAAAKLREFKEKVVLEGVDYISRLN